MAKTPASESEIGVDIQRIEARSITFKLVGVTPIILNRQSEKAKRQLLLPALPQNKAQRTQTLKHDPVEEFRASAYVTRNNPNSLTYLHLPSGMFKQSTRQAAIDVPGATKAQIGRLVSLAAVEIHLWGVPYMKADMVRQAGIARTPDVRFRACVREWATSVTFNYIETLVSPISLANLVSAAGIICGIGDNRVEKGADSYGQFQIVRDDDEQWAEIVETGGRAVQIAAFENPLFYDDETRDLVEWFDAEIDRRRRQPVIEPTAKRKARAAAGVAQ